jgi:hypothetical protein
MVEYRQQKRHVQASFRMLTACGVHAGSSITSNDMPSLGQRGALLHQVCPTGKGKNYRASLQYPSGLHHILRIPSLPLVSQSSFDQSVYQALRQDGIGADVSDAKLHALLPMPLHSSLSLRTTEESLRKGFGSYGNITGVVCSILAL